MSLTSKTLTTPVISQISNTGVLTLNWTKKDYFWQIREKIFIV